MKLDWVSDRILSEAGNIRKAFLGISLIESHRISNPEATSEEWAAALGKLERVIGNLGESALKIRCALILAEPPTLEQLAKAQNVKPVGNVKDLAGGWPGEVDDGFEDAIDELRHPERRKED